MIDRGRLADLLVAEERRFVETHPRSAALAERADGPLLAGVPMPWMTRWAGSFPVFVESATGARFTDVDGIEYVDLCLGDTGAMTGHALPAVSVAVAERATKGITTMLPSEDAIWVADELAHRFGLPRWQFAMTATDANRFVLRFARHLTGRPRIAVFDWCYHGTVDETLAVLEDGRVVPRPGAMGPQVDVALTTAVVPFNDLDALDRRLAEGDVACLLMEPALTNIGIVLPADGYSEGVREITRKHDVLLVIDETHTLCAGPGGCTAAWGLEPDLLVVGKPIAGGVPLAAYGMTQQVADRLTPLMLTAEADVSGVGGTLTANALALAAARAALSSALREEDFAVAIPLAERFTEGVQGVIARHGLAWNVQRLGCRAEYWFCPPPRDGAAAAAAVDEDLEQLMHLWALNRGVLLTPFHNMALFSPAHSEADVDRHTEVFGEALDALFRARVVPEVRDRPSGSQSLALELGDRPFVPARHHPAGQQRLGVEHVHHLLGVVGPVGGQPPHGTGLEPCGRQRRERRRDQTALVMLLLVPRVGEERPQLGQPTRREQVLHRPHGVHGAEPHVGRTRLGHAPEGVGDAGPPDLEGQHVVRRPRGRECRRRLADPRADLHDHRRLASEPVRPAEARPVDRLVGDHPALVVGDPRLLLARGEAVAAAGVGEHLPHPAAVVGEPLVGARRALRHPAARRPGRSGAGRRGCRGRGGR